ncbi:type VI secretion system Vgr family protein [Chryseobacterium sp. OSA05B]|uniref:type VI secretion system Vgr family protein n=1 Tax=Chryseobacterium sp. OSA05B TaxID=2862650 RepID=UPI001CBDA417|nr:phage baseplate assembly protein V [Chryseobacterium sp. OSA05B]
MKKSTSNSEKISENDISGINRVVRLDIVIEGQIIKHFKHFRLQQSAKKHHEFELILAHDSLGKAQNHNLLESQKFLGQRLTVTFRYKDSENESPERSFVGLITTVAFSQDKMSLGNIILKGKSPTILMDAAPHTQSFGGSQSVNTGIIAERVIKETLGSGKFDFKVNSQNKSYINYSAQYNETHYNYLARIAESYGEQFYYDGYVLHFGSLPAAEKPIPLVYGSNVTNVQVEMNAVHTKPQFFGYDSSSHAKMLSTSTSVKHLGELASKAYQLNDGIFTSQSLTPAPINANISIDVDQSQKSAAGNAAVEVFTVSGDTTVPFLYPGCTADIQMRKPDTNETSHFTKLMITETIHEVDARGYYTGSFEAIAEGTGFMPRHEFKIPNAEPQIATVISNTDPLNQGRIQVQFDWQQNNTTHFIRMMSPDAGGTDQITQNRGFVAVPEVGDQVMVGFEYHHPDFPFAMGGMFHGKVGLGGGIDNHVKSIQTRSGNKVIFNDTEGSIFIEDPSGNSYLMDGKGNITVTAPKNMTFIAGENLMISVGQNMSTTVGADQSNIVGMNKSESVTMNDTQSVGAMKITSVIGDASMMISGKLTEIIDGDVQSEVKKERKEYAAEVEHSSNEGTIHQNAKVEVKNNSGEKSSNF